MHLASKTELSFHWHKAEGDELSKYYLLPFMESIIQINMQIPICLVSVFIDRIASLEKRLPIQVK